MYLNTFLKSITRIWNSINFDNYIYNKYVITSYFRRTLSYWSILECKQKLTSLSMGSHLILYTLILTFYFLHSWLGNASLSSDSELVLLKLVITDELKSSCRPTSVILKLVCVISLERLLHVIVTIVIIIASVIVEFIVFARIIRDIDLRYPMCCEIPLICEKHIEGASSIFWNFH